MTDLVSLSDIQSQLQANAETFVEINTAYYVAQQAQVKYEADRVASAATIDDLTQRNDHLALLLVEDANTIAQLNNVIADSQSSNSALAGTVTSLQGQVVTLTQTNAALDAKCIRLANDCLDLTHEVETLEAALAAAQAAIMPTYYISPTGSDTTGDGSQARPWRNIAKLNAMLTPGDVGSIAPGTYTGTSNVIAPVKSGIAGKHITYRASAPGVVIDKVAADLRGKSYVTLEGLTFTSSGTMYVMTSDTSHYIWIQKCSFSSTWAGVAFPWAGIDLNGDYCRVHTCTFGQWMGGDMIQVYGDYCWVKGNDMNYADSGHSPIAMRGNYPVFQQNYVRNKWGRAGVFAADAADATATPLYALILDNDFVDCNCIGDGTVNEGYPLQGVALTNSHGTPGQETMFKVGGRGPIFRGNFVLGCNTANFDFVNRPYKAIIQIGNFDSTVYYEKLHFYHNTFFDNAHNHFSYTENANPVHAFAYDNSRFLNNVLAQSNGGLAFRMAVAGATYPATFKIQNNLMVDQIRRGATVYPIANYQSAFPSQANGNITTAATFVDPNYSVAIGSVAARANRISRDNFLLASGAGKAAARHLATVAANSSGNTITLGSGEAGFFSDGNTLIPGDEISVNGNVRRITAIDRAADTLTLSDAVTVASGALVYLTKFGTSPDMGIA